MNRMRGAVTLIAGAIALWKAGQLHRGQMALLAGGLDLLALALGLWLLTRKEPPARPRR